MGIKAVLLDIDGVLTIRDRVIEGASQTLKELRKLQNNPRHKYDEGSLSHNF